MKITLIPAAFAGGNTYLCAGEKIIVLSSTPTQEEIDSACQRLQQSKPATRKKTKTSSPNTNEELPLFSMSSEENNNDTQSIAPTDEPTPSAPVEEPVATSQSQDDELDFLSFVATSQSQDDELDFLFFDSDETDNNTSSNSVVTSATETASDNNVSLNQEETPNEKPTPVDASPTQEQGAAVNVQNELGDEKDGVTPDKSEEIQQENATADTTAEKENKRVVYEPEKIETAEDAANYRLTYGKYKGQTLGYVASVNPNYIKYLAENFSTPLIVKSAAIVLIKEALSA